MRTNYDVVIIGAGPAGSTAAKGLAQAGLKVLLAEQRLSIGEKVQCAEFVPRIITRYAPIRPMDIAQTIDGIQTWIQGQLVHTLKAPGYILHRKHWDKQLAAIAVAAGAHMVSGTRALEWQKHSTLTLESGNKRQLVTCQWVIGCDGPRSIVSTWLGNQNQPTSVSLQYEMALSRPMNHVGVYFDPRYFGGYAWVFPKGDRANVGIGIHSTHTDKLEQLLGFFCQDLIAQQVLPDSVVYSKTAGRIPCGGLVERIAAGNILVAGDAAGCTHPVTGGGILHALVSGQLAAENIARNFYNKMDKGQVAASYEQDIRNEFGPLLDKGRRKILTRDENWQNNEKEFADIIRRSWISFPEYYAEG